VDKDGTWLKKRGKYHFGFKKHHVTDDEGLVLGVLTTTAVSFWRSFFSDIFVGYFIQTVSFHSFLFHIVIF
jgi:IS5 family transposase